MLLSYDGGVLGFRTRKHRRMIGMGEWVLIRDIDRIGHVVHWNEGWLTAVKQYTVVSDGEYFFVPPDALIPLDEL